MIVDRSFFLEIRRSPTASMLEMKVAFDDAAEAIAFNSDLIELYLLYARNVKPPSEPDMASD